MSQSNSNTDDSCNNVSDRKSKEKEFEEIMNNLNKACGGQTSVVASVSQSVAAFGKLAADNIHPAFGVLAVLPAVVDTAVKCHSASQAVYALQLYVEKNKSDLEHELQRLKLHYEDKEKERDGKLRELELKLQDAINSRQVDLEKLEKMLCEKRLALEEENKQRKMIIDSNIEQLKFQLELKRQEQEMMEKKFEHEEKMMAMQLELAKYSNNGCDV